MSMGEYGVKRVTLMDHILITGTTQATVHLPFGLKLARWLVTKRDLSVILSTYSRYSVIVVFYLLIHILSRKGGPVKRLMSHDAAASSEGLYLFIYFLEKRLPVSTATRTLLSQLYCPMSLQIKIFRNT